MNIKIIFLTVLFITRVAFAFEVSGFLKAEMCSYDTRMSLIDEQGLVSFVVPFDYAKTNNPYKGNTDIPNSGINDDGEENKPAYSLKVNPLYGKEKFKIQIEGLKDGKVHVNVLFRLENNDFTNTYGPEFKIRKGELKRWEVEYNNPPNSKPVLKEVPANHLPIAEFKASVLQGKAPLKVDFDASISKDVDGKIINYAWNFGDDETSSGVKSSHVYKKTGDMKVKLFVTDDKNEKMSKEIVIKVLP